MSSHWEANSTGTTPAACAGPGEGEKGGWADGGVAGIRIRGGLTASKAELPLLSGPLHEARTKAMPPHPHIPSLHNGTNARTPANTAAGMLQGRVCIRRARGKRVRWGSHAEVGGEAGQEALQQKV